jgi:tRNA pseudouridine55 synthase
MSDGVLNLDKPRGLTSHDVVARVRKLLDIRRVGHTGTLDPLATGVLVVCVGRATRLAEYLTSETKVYRTGLRLGVTTDTFDAEGRTIASAPVTATRDDLLAAMEDFKGTISQRPPLYSAVKRAGVPLHRLIRKGADISRESLEPRSVVISRLELVAWEPPSCVLELECSSGTYVRALVHDLGQALGCGAHVRSLTRLASGHYRLADAISLAALASAVEEGRLRDVLLPLGESLSHLPAVHLDLQDARRICSGQPTSDPIMASGEGEIARAYGPGGDFLAVVTKGDGGHWRPRKVFCSPESVSCA